MPTSISRRGSVMESIACGSHSHTAIIGDNNHVHIHAGNISTGCSDVQSALSQLDDNRSYSVPQGRYEIPKVIAGKTPGTKRVNPDYYPEGEAGVQEAMHRIDWRKPIKLEFETEEGSPVIIDAHMLSMMPKTEVAFNYDFAAAKPRIEAEMHLMFTSAHAKFVGEYDNEPEEKEMANDYALLNDFKIEDVELGSINEVALDVAVESIKADIGAELREKAGKTYLVKDGSVIEVSIEGFSDLIKKYMSGKTIAQLGEKPYMLKLIKKLGLLEKVTLSAPKTDLDGLFG